MENKSPQELAEAHWKYIEDLLKEHGESDAVISKIGFQVASMKLLCEVLYGFLY
jgi:hypothetical protein